MKFRAWISSLACFVFLSACSADIDLMSDYEEIPVIYGLLDARVDTNYIKITRAFYAQGDAYQSAINPDSSNYPGKLDARLIEYCNGDSVREIILDTITLHGKQQGVFYAPDQKLYYTTEALPMNSSSLKYSYRLKVQLPERLLTCFTELVGNGSFGPQSLAVNFSKEYFGTNRPFIFRPAINGTIYDVFLSFTFKEQRTPDGDSVPRTMMWKVGTYTEEYFENHMDGDNYLITYRPETFYEMLGDFIGGDTAIAGLSRFISDYPADIIISAGGENLRQYILYNEATNGYIGGENNFSVIDGGYGVFSSRMVVRQSVRLAGETVPDLLRMTNWGFRFIGGREE